MPNSTHLATWNTYQDAWADVTPAARRELLSRSVAEDCTFSTPDTEGQGRNNLTVLLDQFQQQYTGAYFKTHKLIDHHNQGLAQWTMYDKTGTEFLSGNSFARFGEDGRLTHLIGFWQL